MSESSRDHAQAIGFALDLADTIARAYTVAICLALLWVLFKHPHLADTRWLFGAFCIATIYSAWPRKSSAKQVDGASSRDEH